MIKRLSSAWWRLALTVPAHRSGFTIPSIHAKCVCLSACRICGRSTIHKMANSILAFSVMKTKAARFLRPLQDEHVATRVWLQRYAAPATRFDPFAKHLLPWRRSFCLFHPSFSALGRVGLLGEPIVALTHLCNFGFCRSSDLLMHFRRGCESSKEVRSFAGQDFFPRASLARLSES